MKTYWGSGSTTTTHSHPRHCMEESGQPHVPVALLSVPIGQKDEWAQKNHVSAKLPHLEGPVYIANAPQETLQKEI
jgi:hypothetical protein